MTGDVRIYIAGKISGVTDFLERFNAAEDRLTRSGFSVINPARTLSALPKDTRREAYMDACYALLKHCDAIYLLDGWESSPGAKKELNYYFGLHGMNTIIYTEHSALPDLTDHVIPPEPYFFKVPEAEKG